MLFAFKTKLPRHAVRRERHLDQGAQHPLRHGRRRHRRAARVPHHAARRDRHHRQLELRQGPRDGLLHLAAAARRWAWSACSAPPTSSCSTCSGRPCSSRCTSSSASGAARGASTRPSSSSCSRWSAACSCCSPSSPSCTTSRTRRRALTFDIQALSTLVYPYHLQFWAFLAFFLAFAIKVPMFPVHTWLPDAHVEAPTAGSVILAGVLLKMGGYGMLRFCLPFFPDAAVTFIPWVVGALGDRHRLRRAGVAGAEGPQEARRLLEREPHGLRHRRHLRRASRWSATPPAWRAPSW